MGTSTEDIAAKFHVSPHTVRTHIKNILRKLDAHTRAHAVAIAYPRTRSTRPSTADDDSARTVAATPRGLVVEPLVADAQHLVAASSQLGIAPPVALELRGRAVVLVAVELDDEPGRPASTSPPHGPRPCRCSRGGDAVLVAQREECDFEVGAACGGSGGLLRQ